MIVGLALSLPFTIIHLIARPDDAPITPLQHLVAAIANYFGPWGVVLVRVVDFPNAGLRAFDWGLALGLTLVGGVLILFAAQLTKRFFQLLLTAVWALFALVWFTVGLTQIASGLL
jgi:hypothetical protein